MVTFVIEKFTEFFNGIVENAGLNMRAARKILLFGVISFALLLLGFTMLKPVLAEADSDNRAIHELKDKSFYGPEGRTVKLVESVQIKKGDSLWSIADKYYTKECGGMKQYINEIKRTNHLSTDTIHEGNYLLVPYYENYYEK